MVGKNPKEVHAHARIQIGIRPQEVEFFVFLPVT